MIQITLKAVHCRLIVQLLKEIVASSVFRTLSEIKAVVTAEIEDDAEVTLNVYPAELLFVYPLLSDLSEGEAAEINKEMDYMLRPQIEAGVQLEDEQLAALWLEVASGIGAHKLTKQASMAQRIEEGRQFLAQ